MYIFVCVYFFKITTMGYQEQIEGKGISSFSISQNGDSTFEKHYSKPKRYIVILTVITLFLAAIFIYYSYTEAELEVCKTKSCLKSTVSLMNSMNESVEPCEDFYEFACGMFETNYPSYSDINENSWETIISLKVKQTVKKFLAKKNEKHEPKAVSKIRLFYQTCLKSVKGDQVDGDYESLRKVWDKIGLDVNYLNDSTPLEIEKVLAKIRSIISTDVFFDIDVDDDPRNSSSHSLLIINQNEDWEKFKKRNDMEIKYKVTTVKEGVPTFIENFELMVNRILNRNQMNFKQLDINDLTNTSEELSNFEKEFEEISHNAYHYKNDVPEIFTLGQLQNLTDSAGDKLKFNWTLYLRELFRDIEPKVYEQLTSANSDDYEVLITNRDYLDDLFNLLSNTSTTIIKMSILTRVVAILENHFPSTDNHLNPNYCFSLTTELFGMVTGYSMINTLDNSSKAALNEMTDNIKWALRKMINEGTWMDDETKNATLRKLANTKTYFGYPNNYTRILNHLFQDLNITNNHVENIISISMFKIKQITRYLIEEKDFENMEWWVTPVEVNAYNSNSMNAFFMSAAILQAPLYHNGIQALNYGATGSTIGHELSHNYDNTGRLYNELGNVAHWWTDKSYQEYTKRAGCFVDHYNGIRIVSHNKTFEVDGIRTLDENIADVVGLKEAYLAYQRYVSKHGREPRLPGMEQYSQEQLFFLAYANQYCHYDKRNIDVNNQNKHSPNIIRVRGVLSLLPEFAKVWSCPLGSPMNPNKKKCKIW